LQKCIPNQDDHHQQVAVTTLPDLMPPDSSRLVLKSVIRQLLGRCWDQPHMYSQWGSKAEAGAGCRLQGKWRSSEDFANLRAWSRVRRKGPDGFAERQP